MDPSEQELMTKVISAHRILMGLSEINQQTFKSLVDVLEMEQQSQGEAKL